MFLSNKLAINNASKSLKPRSSFLNKQVDRQIRDSILSIPNLINFSKDPDILGAIILNDVIPEEEYNKTNDEIFSENNKIKKTVTGTFPTQDYKRQIVKKSTLNNKGERSETMNRSFVVFEKQQYIDKNASFIKTNLNDTEDEELCNRSTIVRPQEIMSKAELSTLINLYEQGKKRASNKKMSFDNITSTELKSSDANILRVNPMIPKLELYSNNFRKFATKSWIDDAFDSPREKESKLVENFEEDNEFSNFNIPGQKDMLNNITSSPHNFIQQKDKKSDISDDEEDFIYDGRNRHIFSFYSKDNKQANTNYIKKNTYANDKTEIEIISEHPQENILNSSHINNYNNSENGTKSIIPGRINFVIENNICDNISSKYKNDTDIKIITVNNFELSEQKDKRKFEENMQFHLKISQREESGVEKTQEDENSRDIPDLPFDIKNLNLLAKKKLNQNKTNLEGFLLKNSFSNPTKPDNYKENNIMNFLNVAAQSDSKLRDSNKLSNYKISQTSSNSSAPSSFSSKFNSSTNIKSELNSKEQISSFKSVASYLGGKSKNIKDYLSGSKQNSNSIDDSKVNSIPETNIMDEKNSRFNRNIYQTTSKLNLQDRSNDFKDLKKTILNAYSTSLSTSKKPSQNNTDSSEATHANNQNIKDTEENPSYSSQYKKLINNKLTQRNSIVQINQVNPIYKTSGILNTNEDLISGNRAKQIVSRNTDNNDESNMITANRLNKNTGVSSNTITNTMPNTMTNFHNYNDFCDLKSIPTKENNTHANASHNEKEKNKSNIFKSQLQCPQHQQYLVLQKALPYSKYNLDLLPKTKAHDEKEVLYSNIADYQTLNQLINSVKKAYNHQIISLKKNYNSKGSAHRSTSPYHRNEKYKLEKKNEKLDNVNKLYSNNHYNKTSKNSQHDKKNNQENNNIIDHCPPDTIDENTLLELLEEIKERSNKIQNHFKEKEENMNSQIIKLNENLKLHKEKEKNLHEEITGWKSKLAYFIEDFRKKNKEDKSDVSKTNFMNTTTKSNELGINVDEIMKEMNDDKNKKSSKIYFYKLDDELNICNLKYNDLPKIISEKTFSQKYNFKKLKSYHLILKEIGLDSTTFYDGVVLSDLEDDICEECFVNDCGSVTKTKSLCFVSNSGLDNEERIIIYF